MAILNREKEGTVQVTCIVSDDVEDVIKRVRKERGRRTGWIIMSAIKGFLKGDIEV